MALRVKLNPDTYDITNILPVPFLFFNLFRSHIIRAHDFSIINKVRARTKCEEGPI